DGPADRPAGRALQPGRRGHPGSAARCRPADGSEPAGPGAGEAQHPPDFGAPEARRQGPGDRPRPAPVEGPVRVLFVACQPRGLPLLNLDREWNWLQEAVRDASPQRVQVKRLDDPTREQLYQKLADGKYHVLHFAGYDSFCISHMNPSQGPPQDEGFVLLNEY